VLYLEPAGVTEVLEQCLQPYQKIGRKDLVVFSL